jgi:hypothetical protein
MSGVYSILGFVAQLKAIEHDMEALGPAIIRKACEMVCTEAQRVIGTYDYNWTPLAPATLAHKFFNTPLLETGEMRDSIEWSTSHDGLEGAVGSNSDIAVWQELGTSKIPPRSFLARAAIEIEPKIHKMAARAVVSVLSGGGLASAEMRELLHLLREAGHALKQAVEDITPDDPDKGNGKRR